MSTYKKFLTLGEARKLLESQSNEFTVINNPDYIHPSYEVVPLALKLHAPLNDLKAIVMDMDGTTTTTEELCIHSLEYMVRKMSGKMKKEDWRGLDETIDYPHIIGNSTTKHVEYLINKYADFFDISKITESFINAAHWTLTNGKDQKRKEEVQLNLSHFNIVLDSIDNLEELIKKNRSKLEKLSKSDLVRVGIDIYYQRYHEILGQIEEGKSRNISEELFNDPEKHLIEPMPSVFIFLALIKGWLGEEIKNLIPQLIKDYELKYGRKFSGNISEVENKLVSISQKFVESPIKTAIVTSSIYYEANIVMKEVFNVISSEINKLNLSDNKKVFLKEKFSDYKNVYNSFVTASDSNEIRLKPHRDLYSIALHQLGISKNLFDQVIGFEDSESGTIAIRAAGIGMCIAVPFAETSGHNLDAATYICKGGLAQSLLDYNLFL